MSKSAVWCLAWNVELARYELVEQTGQGIAVSKMDIERDAWQEWLEQVSSFTFQSKDGSRFTALKERRGRKGAYWIAYRKVGGKLKRKYLGLPKEVTLTALEQAATALRQPETQSPSPPPPLTPSSARDSMLPVSEQLQEQLLATKFLASAPSRPLIPRSRLYTLLNEGSGCPLTLVSAPAGFGKTSLLESWAHTLPAGNFQVAWVSLDEADNDVVRFWSYALIALDRREPGLSEQALTLLHASPAPALKHVLTTLIDALAHTPNRFVLIVDDYHLISESAIHTSLEFLLERHPPQLRLILLSRGEPPLKLSQLRARGQLLEVCGSDLRCSVEEAMQFLGEVMGIRLPDDLLEQVMARTEGWLAGLQLLGLFLREHADPDHFLDALGGSERYILDYLTEEVLQRQPAAIEEFLLCTSILDHLSGPLCDAVMAQTNSQEVLEELERANIFVYSLDEQQHWFRYHVLFAEALRYQLERTHVPLLSTLHSRASQWYAEHNQLREAVQHALLAHDWQRAADLIEPLTETHLWRRYEEVWRRYEEVPMMLQWLRQLPSEIVRTRPRIALYYAGILFIAGHLKEVEHWVQAAEVGLTATDALSSPVRAESPETTYSTSVTSLRDHERERLLGEIVARRAVVAAYYGEGQRAHEQCLLALSYLSEQDPFQQSLVAVAQGLSALSEGQAVVATQHLLQAGTLMQAMGISGAAINYLSLAASFLHIQGRLHEAWQLCQQATQLGTSPEGHLSASVGVAYAYQADVLREWHQLDTALDLALQGIHFIEQTKYTLYVDTAYMILVRIYLSRGEVEAANTTFQQVMQLPMIVDNAYRRSWLTAVERVQLWLARGELERATHWAEQLAQGKRLNTPLAREQGDLARVRVQLARHQPDEALTLLEPLIAGATATGRIDHVIEMWLLEALAHVTRKAEREALAALSEAVRLGEPEGYIRRFVDEGPLMVGLLSRLREQRRRRGPTPYLDRVLAAFAQKGAVEKLLPQHGLQDPLSERELEVLRELAHGASNQEIGDGLVIAADTVKRHVSNILAKLEASNRMHAVARARHLGLIQEE
ncbi:MAG: LuxR C-terminal-related transcriptional regulator [Ktedonobacteraceae bacterium]